MSKFSIVVLLFIGFLFTSPLAQADVINDSFETGDFTGWDTLGGGTGIYGASSGGPTDGLYQAYLSTSGSADAYSLENFFGVPSGSLYALGNGGATAGSGIKQTISANAGDLLLFDWNFLPGDYLPYNDFAFYSLNGVSTIANITAYPNYIPSGFHTASLTIPATGLYTFGFGITDVGDWGVDSGLMVDNIRLLQSTAAVPEPSTLLLGLLGLAGLTAKKFFRS